MRTRAENCRISTDIARQAVAIGWHVLLTALSRRLVRMETVVSCCGLSARDATAISERRGLGVGQSIQWNDIRRTRNVVAFAGATPFQTARDDRGAGHARSWHSAHRVRLDVPPYPEFDPLAPVRLCGDVWTSSVPDTVAVIGVTLVLDVLASRSCGVAS